MTRRSLIGILMLLAAGMAQAIPVERGTRRTLTLSDGSQVVAELCGDEHLHWWQGDDGKAYVPASNDSTFRVADLSQMKQQALQRQLEVKQRQQEVRQAARPIGSKHAPRRTGLGEQGDFNGVRRGLVIMVEFNNRKFPPRHNAAFFQRVMTEENFQNGEGFKGSVRDYFLAQSSGKFDLQIDVKGPVQMPQNYEYYGKDRGQNYDVNVVEMVTTAIEMADSLVDYSQYDWDGDGVVDQVVLLYAGTGQHYGTGTDYIYPHESTLAGLLGYYPEYDGIKLDNYAVVNEVKPTNIADGLGVFCHEFSHCMGIPDMYDIYYKGNYGMGSWDLLHYGGNLGNGFVPAGYTAYERMQCGWKQPIELVRDTVITGMKPLSEDGDTYIIYNKAHPDEYYLLENRAKTGWDTELPGEGLLVTYVDFDPVVWAYNIVNSTADLYVPYGYASNDHQRVTIFHADNDDDTAYYDPSRGRSTTQTEEGDPYPTEQNNCLSNNSLPADTLYHLNTDSTKFMNIEISDIRRNPQDGTISFTFHNHNNGTNYISEVKNGIAPSQESFDLLGRRIPSSQHGLRLVRQPDGTIRKVLNNQN